MQRIQNYSFEFEGVEDYTVSIDLSSVVVIAGWTLLGDGNKLPPSSKHEVAIAGISDTIKIPATRHNDDQVALLYRHWQDYKNDGRWVR